MTDTDPTAAVLAAMTAADDRRDAAYRAVAALHNLALTIDPAHPDAPAVAADADALNAAALTARSASFQTDDPAEYAEHAATVADKADALVALARRAAPLLLPVKAPTR